MRPRPNPQRAMTWRQLLKKHASEFLEWLESSGKRFEYFDRLATALEVFLLHHVLVEGREASAVSNDFAQALPLVFANCNEPIYDKPFVAEAYAFVHLLERYRRFWAVLEALMKAGTLPMRDSGIDVLDVGVGPGPALYATNDFYELLNFYADSSGIAGLRTPLPKLHAIEESTNMVHVIHRISVVRGRAGRFD